MLSEKKKETAYVHTIHCLSRDKEMVRVHAIHCPSRDRDSALEPEPNEISEFKKAIESLEKGRKDCDINSIIGRFQQAPRES